MSVIDEPATRQALPGGSWSIDPARSSVGFAIKHMTLRTLHGSFREFEGSLELSDGAPRACGSVGADSIETGDSTRDQHLRDSSDFFDVAHHPRITFRSTAIVPAGKHKLHIEGALSMRGITRQLTLEGEFRQITGERRIELDLRGELNRKDFGLTWNQTLDAGGALLGNRVKIELLLAAFTSPTADS